MYELRKSCQTSLLSTVPGRHAGLGLEPYARVTSPLRRYEDLLAHLQLRRHLKGEAPLGAEEMDARLAVAEPAANLRRKLERQCNEYWTMVYLAARPGWQGETIPVARQDDRITWLIPELAYEFKNRFGGKTVLGEAATAVLTGVDPATLSIQFRIGR
ncbi:Ribonuclease R [bioreactor metagenome]|uniref:Ribonuclease R n=1 Tax=bioreactor metagenome TaxID=1076179 RepID=A0A645CW17_9ZZZZ